MLYLPSVNCLRMQYILLMGSGTLAALGILTLGFAGAGIFLLAFAFRYFSL